MDRHLRFTAGVVVGLSLAALLGCGGGGGGTGVSAGVAKPAILAFTASPSVIASGGSSHLAWSVQGADQVLLNDGVISGSSSTVSPTSTTVYTLKASNGAGSVSATATVSVGGVAAVFGNLSGADLGAGANLNGALPFPADNAWNTDISSSAVASNSNAILTHIGLSTGLHPDFGAGLYNGAPIGIPYIVVAGTQPKVAVSFVDYADESDPGPYPVPADAPIEGQRADGAAFAGDRHVLVLDRDASRLYELANAYPLGTGAWNAACGALFHLDSNTVRPGGQAGWTSADAAGLPIFPGLARYEEASSGVIRHALRFTVGTTRRAYVFPATHWASSDTSVDRPPMGMRVRLKASFAIPSGFSTESRAILQALKTYGMLVADNGSNWFISGAPDDRWNNDLLVAELGSVKGSDFEVLQMDGLVIP